MYLHHFELLELELEVILVIAYSSCRYCTLFPHDCDVRIRTTKSSGSRPSLGIRLLHRRRPSVTPAYEQHQPTRSFGSMFVIEAKPISMVAPDEVSEEMTPKVATRRNPEEMAKRPSWLPENWKIDLRVRSSGAIAGVIDRYYLDPSGRKYRSKNEVRHFLETGKRLKR